MLDSIEITLKSHFRRIYHLSVIIYTQRYYGRYVSRTYAFDAIFF